MKLRVFTISEIVRVREQLHAALTRSFVRAAVGLGRLVEIAGDAHVGQVSFLQEIQIIKLFFFGFVTPTISRRHTVVHLKSCY